MIIFILRRLLLLIITLFILLLVGFGLCYFTQDSVLQDGKVFDALKFYLIHLMQGDFGISIINGQPVSQQLRDTFPATIELCILAFALALFFGIPLGIIAGTLPGKWADRVISSLALIGFSTPVFCLAILLILFFSLHLDLLPVSGRVDLLYQVKPITGMVLLDAWLSDSPLRHEIIISVLNHMILPITALAVAPTTEVIRLMRISTWDVFSQNYIKAAATRGLSRLTIIHRHVLHNALPPIIPKLGLQFSTLLTLAMTTEVIFNWPGLGRWLIDAIRQQDHAAISAGVVVTGSLVLVINVLSDFLAAMSNRLKHKEWYAL